MKKCTKCNKLKELSCFSKQKIGKFGVRSRCKECIRGIADSELLKRTCINCNINLKSLIPYKKFCNNICKQKNYRKNNPKQNYLTNKVWKDSNRDHINIQSRLKYQNNPSKYIAKTRKRQAIKFNATLSGYDDEILKIYQKCPPGYEVHHIIPLQEFSNKVCGLHVPWNLEILTKEEHLLKHKELRRHYL